VREWMLPKLVGTAEVPLDIETSTPDESDEWLAAQGEEEGTSKVDVIGSELTGMSLTFGDNLQHTVYISVDHADTANLPKQLLQVFIKECSDAGVKFVIHNYNFEGPVLFNEWAADWLDNGSEGFLPNCLDTKLEASYVDENDRLGLKRLSKKWFDYDQVDYKTVTTIDGVPHKMRELSGAHVKDYGCDDTIVTGSLHNFFKLFMQLEHTYKVYLQVEIDAMYAHAQSFVHGVKCDVAKIKELEALDDATYIASEAVLSAYLVSKGWSGTVAPVYDSSSTPAHIKEAFHIVYGRPLETAVRKLERIADAMDEQGAKSLAHFVREERWEQMTSHVRSYWKAQPIFNTGSPKQLQKLMYEVMALPVRVFNKPTPIMRKAGVTGSPKTDTLAITYALRQTPTKSKWLCLKP
jgi:DNA polymerase I-like protein with 3'-5' exonuclease and polymerase domains